MMQINTMSDLIPLVKHGDRVCAIIDGLYRSGSFVEMVDEETARVVFDAVDKLGPERYLIPIGMLSRCRTRTKLNQRQRKGMCKVLAAMMDLIEVDDFCILSDQLQNMYLRV